MTYERFRELMRLEGYTDDEIDVLWDTHPYDMDSIIEEKVVNAARLIRDSGLLSMTRAAEKRIGPERVKEINRQIKQDAEMARSLQLDPHDVIELPKG